MSELAALLQLADAAFPAGAFAHSFGLETAIVEGRVRDEATLDAWLRAALHGTFAPLDGAAFVLALRDEVAAELLDDRLRAMQPNAELRKANAHLARGDAGNIRRARTDVTAPRGVPASIATERCAGSTPSPPRSATMRPASRGIPR